MAIPVISSEPALHESISAVSVLSVSPSTVVDSFHLRFVFFLLIIFLSLGFEVVGVRKSSGLFFVRDKYFRVNLYTAQISLSMALRSYWYISEKFSSCYCSLQNESSRFRLLVLQRGFGGDKEN